MYASSKQSWKFLAAAPPREVFAVMEQLIGTPPYRFEPVDADSARIVEFERQGLVGNWVKAKRRVRWVSCKAVVHPQGTQVEVEASSGKGPITRGLQLVQLLSRGAHDSRTIYRERIIPEGPVSLVASWAGTPYAVFTAPRFDAPRGTKILTATRVLATGSSEGPFVQVKLEDGSIVYVERDEIVPAPEVATRAAQTQTARRI